MESARRIIKNSVWLILGEFISKICIFFLLIVVARTIGVANFGKYNFALSFVMFVSLFSDLGLQRFLYRELARNTDQKVIYITNFLVLRVVVSLFFMIIVFLFSFFSNYQDDVKQLINYFSLWLFSLGVVNIFKSGFRALEIMHLEAYLNVMENILRFILALVLLRAGYGVIGVAMAYVIAGFVSIIVGFFLSDLPANAKVFPLDFKLLVLALKEMRFLSVVAFFVGFFGFSDVLILTHFRGNEAAGLFGAPFKLVWMLLMLPGLITEANFAKLSQLATRDPNRFKILLNLLVRFNLCISFALAFLITLFSDRIISVVFGSQFASSAVVLRILVWYLVLYACNIVFTYALNACNEQKINAVFLSIAIILNIFLDAVLSWKFSYVGTSFAPIISSGILFTLYLSYFFRKKSIVLASFIPSVSDFRMFKDILFKKPSN